MWKKLKVPESAIPVAAPLMNALGGYELSSEGPHPDGGRLYVFRELDGCSDLDRTTFKLKFSVWEIDGAGP